jgi:hypothetical protein
MQYTRRAGAGPASRRIACIAILAGLTACSGAADPAATAPAPATAAVSPEEWAGRWTGPEGTWLEITPDGSAYSVTISNLDGPRTYAATLAANGLAFERDGLHEVLRATDGEGTGMKWLADKTRCLVVRPGEGFCRD